MVKLKEQFDILGNNSFVFLLTDDNIYIIFMPVCYILYSWLT